MEFQEFQKIPRLSREIVITEKIDGTNGQIYIEHVPTQAEIEGLSYDEIRYGDKEILFNSDEWTIRAGSRTKWITPKDDNYGFANWVKQNAEELLKLGEGRHYGEWWGQRIQRGYNLKEKRFSLFNTSKWHCNFNNGVNNGELTLETTRCLEVSCCFVVPILSRGGLFDTRHIEQVLDNLRVFGSFASPGYMNPEGIVIYHIAGNLYFKKTINNDESPKGLVK